MNIATASFIIDNMPMTEEQYARGTKTTARSLESFVAKHYPLHKDDVAADGMLKAARWFER